MKISTSILSANFAKLEEEITLLEQAGTDMIHLDVMDGNFVPNLTFGPPLIKSIRPLTKLTFDVHLMIQTPERWIEQYAKAGADIITIHPESSTHFHRTISSIKDHGLKAGIALLPTTTAEIIDYILDDIDLILVMSVNPGFGGQKFITSQIEKISILSAKIADLDIILSVDGGINPITAKDCFISGANCLVAGQYIMSGDYATKISELRNACKVSHKEK